MSKNLDGDRRWETGKGLMKKAGKEERGTSEADFRRIHGLD
jgi:hypothetical protein